MKNLHLSLAALLLILATSCGKGDSSAVENKKIAELLCQAKGADKAKGTELEKEIRSLVTISQSKAMEKAKAQKEKTPEAFMKEAAEKMKEAINAEVAKSCGLTKDEIDNFMRSGKMQKTDVGPHVNEVKGLTPEVFNYTSTGRTERYTKVGDNEITVWAIDYNKNNGVEISRKEVIKFANIETRDLEKSLTPVAVATKLYTEGSFDFTVNAKMNPDLFEIESFVINDKLQNVDMGMVTLSFKTMAAAQAIADKIKAATAAN
jgi:hypothetical protein